MALTLDECDAMVAAAERAGSRLVVGHSHGFDYRQLAATIAAQGARRGPELPGARGVEQPGKLQAHREDDRPSQAPQP